MTVNWRCRTVCNEPSLGQECFVAAENLNDSLVEMVGRGNIELAGSLKGNRGRNPPKMRENREPTIPRM